MYSLMSTTDFRSATYIGILYKRSHLVPIDTQLGRTHSSSGNPDQYVKELVTLTDECSIWIKGKEDKNHGEPPSKHQDKRMKAVLLLQKQAYLDLKTAMFALRKSKGAISQTVTLSKGFDRERDEFVAMKSQLPDKSYRLDPRSSSAVAAAYGAAANPARNGGLSQEAKDIVSTKTFTELSADEFDTLSAEFKTAFREDLAAKGYRPRVHYVRKLERISNNMLIPIHGMLYGDNAQTPYSTVGNNFYIYAIDRYGNVMVAMEGLFRGGDGPTQESEYRHSSLNAGRDVTSAGRIKIKSGKVVEIDNWSGHYKPTIQHLANGLAVLNGYSLDLSQTKINVYNAAKLVDSWTGYKQFKAKVPGAFAFHAG